MRRPKKGALDNTKESGDKMRDAFSKKMKPLPPLANSVKKMQQNVQVEQAAQQPSPVQQPPPVQQPSPVQQPPPQPVQNSSNDQNFIHDQEMQDIPIVQTDTYISIGDKNQGIVEFDLMSHREKGQEVRYLHIQVRGYSLDEKGTPSNTYMALQNKEDFEKVKSFFSTLKWED